MFGHHLVQVIFDDYVGITLSTLSRLDVAFCSAELRQDLLEVMASLKKIKVESAWGDVEKYRHLPNYLCWLASRRCHVSWLDADASCLPTTLSQLRGSGISLPNTTSVTLFYCTSISCYRTCDGPFSVAPFLAMFPNLKELNWSSWTGISDSMLSQLQSLQCPLEILKLNSHELTSKCVVEVVSHFSATMRCLDCRILDESALLQLSRMHLPRFQQLSIHCWHLKSSVAFEQFCESVSGTLESLTFTSKQQANNPLPFPITNHTIKVITKSCHRLKVIDFKNEYFGEDSFTLESSPDIEKLLCFLPDVMAGCPDIERLTFLTDTIEFINGNPAVEVFRLHGDPDTLMKICAQMSSLHVAVRKIHFEFSLNDGYVYTECIRFVADHFGPELTSFVGHFKDNNDDTLIYFLSRCPNLTVLDLNSCHSISDRSFAMIPVYCPKIVVLALGYSDLVTAATVVSVLQQLHDNGNAVKEVRFEECDQMNKSTVKTITALFPKASIDFCFNC